VIQAARGHSARGIIDAIFESLGAFRDGQPLADDVTAVAVKIVE
jgi:serine phosphatase RsbU (regulator of sigma subunit)